MAIVSIQHCPAWNSSILWIGSNNVITYHFYLLLGKSQRLDYLRIYRYPIGRFTSNSLKKSPRFQSFMESFVFVVHRYCSLTSGWHFFGDEVNFLAWLVAMIKDDVGNWSWFIESSDLQRFQRAKSMLCDRQSLVQRTDHGVITFILNLGAWHMSLLF